MFGNPVAQAVIRPHGSPPIPGNFRVTAPFGAIDADHPTPHGGVDIGNGRCGEPLLAMTTGRVSLAGKVPGSDALIVRIVSDAYPDYEPAVAHCASIAPGIKVGSLVTEGQVVAVLGKSGTTACHAHLGCKQKINGVWVSVDIWPLLNQNQESEVLLGTNPLRVTNRFTATHANTKFRRDPSTAKPELLIVPGGTRFEPDFEVGGQVVAGSARWYSGMLPVAGALTRGYFHESTLAPLLPIEQTGVPQAKYDADMEALIARLNGVKAKVAANAVDVAND
jgi:hypothetical protein